MHQSLDAGYCSCYIKNNKRIDMKNLILFLIYTLLLSAAHIAQAEKSSKDDLISKQIKPFKMLKDDEPQLKEVLTTDKVTPKNKDTYSWQMQDFEELNKEFPATIEANKHAKKKPKNESDIIYWQIKPFKELSQEAKDLLKNK